MASVARINGIPPVIAGNTVSLSQIALFVIDAGGDLRTEDDAANEACELILSIVQPLAYCFVNDNSGQMSVVMDGHSVTAASLQARLRELGTTAGPNDYDASGATVTAATTFVVA